MKDMMLWVAGGLFAYSVSMMPVTGMLFARYVKSGNLTDALRANKAWQGAETRLSVAFWAALALLLAWAVA